MEIKKITGKVYLSAALVIISALTQFCGGKHGSGDALVVFINGDVTVERNSEKHMARAGERLRSGDVIESGEKSSMALQVSDRFIFRVEPGTRVTVNALSESGRSELGLIRGTLLSKISKLGREESYIVKTPTVTASVRGTVFSTTCDRETSSVAVSLGRVNVLKASGGKNVIVEGGSAVTVREELENSGISAKEKLILKKIEDLDLVERPDSMDDARISALNRTILEKDRPVDEELGRLNEQNRLLSMDEIRAKYGRIDTVTLFNGKTHMGAITSRSGGITMVTPEGIIHLDAGKIKQTQSR
jgi:hypothetical protein